MVRICCTLNQYLITKQKTDKGNKKRIKERNNSEERVHMDSNHARIDESYTKELILLAQRGCKKSEELLFLANQKLIHSIVNRIQAPRDLKEDLFQIGTIGLLKSVHSFDLSKNVRFSTYAVPMMFGEIRRFLRDHQTSIKIGRDLKSNHYKIKKFQERFYQETGQQATLADVSHALSIDTETCVESMMIPEQIISLSQPIHSSAETHLERSMEDKIPSDVNPIDLWFVKQSIQEAMQKLEEKEQEIIKLRFFDEKTQSETGLFLGISQAHVSRIEKNVLHKLKSMIQSA